MAALTASQLLQITDKLAAASNAGIGTAGSGYGFGDIKQVIGSDWGLSRKFRDLEVLVLGFADYDREANEGSLIHALQTKAPFEYALPYFFTAVLNGVLRDCDLAGLVGVTDLNSFASYYNVGAGGWWNALLCPDFATLYATCFSSLATFVALSRLNVYSPAIATMATKVVGGSFTHSTDVDTTKYAGAAIANVTASGLTGSDVVTVTGTNHNGVASRTWTATVTSSTTFALTPTVAGDLLTIVSAISAGGGISAGTLVVSAAIPAGRTNPPT